MRNLGLALMFGVMVAAPHAVHAKKHVSHKQVRTAKRHAPKRARHAREEAPRPEADDELASAVARKRATEKPTMTAAAPAEEPAVSNAPVNMTNQTLDDEVPGKKKR